MARTPSRGASLEALRTACEPYTSRREEQKHPGYPTHQGTASRRRTGEPAPACLAPTASGAARYAQRWAATMGVQVRTLLRKAAWLVFDVVVLVTVALCVVLCIVLLFLLFLLEGRLASGIPLSFLPGLSSSSSFARCSQGTSSSRTQPTATYITSRITQPATANQPQATIRQPIDSKRAVATSAALPSTAPFRVA